MPEFAWPLALLLLVLPWLATRWLSWPTATPALHMPGRPLAGNTARRLVPANWRRPKVLALLAWFCLVVALARPLWPETIPVSSDPAPRSLLLILDISASMDAEDLLLHGKPASRLTVAKAVAAELVQNLTAYRAGLIVFGNEAHVHTPVTRDKPALLDGLSALQSGLAGRGSSLDDALALAASRLGPGDEQSLVIVLSDDDTRPGKRASDDEGSSPGSAGSVKINALLIAGTQRSPKAASLPSTRLQAIAERSGGTFAHVVQSEALRSFLEIIRRTGEDAITPATTTRWRELYPWPLAMALAISIGLGLYVSRPKVLG